MLNRRWLIIGVVWLVGVVALLLIQGGGSSAQVSFMIFGDPAEIAAYEGLVAAFHEQHPDTRVELIKVADQADYRARLAADFAGGTPPDVMLINYRRMAQFADAGVLEALQPYVENSSVINLDEFYENSIEPFYWDGVLQCIPQNLSSLVVFYNRDLFDAAGIPYPQMGWTRDDFLATAEALTIDADGDGTPEQYGLGIEPSMIRLMPFIWGNGGDVVDFYDQPTGLTMFREEAVTAYLWFVALSTEHGVVPSRVEEQAQDSESRFMNGTTAMFLNSRRGVPTYRGITGFTWDAAALPVGPAGPAGILHADAYCMAAAAKDKPAAWRFIEFANSVEGQTLVARSGRTVPSLRAVAESPAFLDPTVPPANSRVFLDTIPAIRALPRMVYWVDIELIFSEEIERAFYGETEPLEALRVAGRRSIEYMELEVLRWRGP